MRNTLKDFKVRALARPDVRREYEGLKEEFEVLDEILQARAKRDLPGLTVKGCPVSIHSGSVMDTI